MCHVMRLTVHLLILHARNVCLCSLYLICQSLNNNDYDVVAEGKVAKKVTIQPKPEEQKKRAESDKPTFRSVSLIIVSVSQLKLF